MLNPQTEPAIEPEREVPVQSSPIPARKLVRFEEVSKGYRLGLTRTSLPRLVASWFRRSPIGRVAGGNGDRGYLWALKNVSFDLEPGESLALVGPNGAGKTTILKLLANITKPSTGEIQVNGRLSALIELGAGFHPELTGRENIFLNGTILGLQRSEIEKRFDEIVEFSELSRFIDTPVKRYSSGMTVRLGFAVAACIDPEILLVDEVLAVGDAAFRQKCLGRIQELLDRGTSIIFVSHNLYMVHAVCRKAIYLRNGSIQLAGKTEQILEAYESDLHADRARKFDRDRGVSKGRSAGGVEITAVQVTGKGGADGRLLNSEAAEIAIDYLAERDLGRVQMSLFIIRSDGMSCCMVRSRHADCCLEVGRGRGRITVRLQPLQLITGTYFVEAFFLNEADSLPLTPGPARSEWFHVKGLARSYEDDSGVYEPITSWFQAT